MNERKSHYRVPQDQYVECTERDKWLKLNDLLSQQGMPIIDTGNGASEASIIMTLYTLLRENQTLRKKVEIGDFSLVKNLERDLEGQNMANLKLEQTVFVSRFETN